MALCSENNPCSCISVSTKKAPTPCPTVEACCVKACDSLIKPCDAVGPCGQVGTTDLTAINHQTDGCGGQIVYRLVSFDKTIFHSVSLLTNGELTWVTKGPETVGKIGDICFKVSCLAKEECADCFELGDIATLRIGVKDLCLGNACEECETCNPCTGVCDKNDVNIVAGNDVSSSNLTAT